LTEGRESAIIDSDGGACDLLALAEAYNANLITADRRLCEQVPVVEMFLK